MLDKKFMLEMLEDHINAMSNFESVAYQMGNMKAVAFYRGKRAGYISAVRLLRCFDPAIDAIGERHVATLERDNAREQCYIEGKD